MLWTELALLTMVSLIIFFQWSQPAQRLPRLFALTLTVIVVALGDVLATAGRLVVNRRDGRVRLVPVVVRNVVAVRTGASRRHRLG